jgi:hypothetical protein
MRQFYLTRDKYNEPPLPNFTVSMHSEMKDFYSTSANLFSTKISKEIPFKQQREEEKKKRSVQTTKTTVEDISIKKQKYCEDNDDMIFENVNFNKDIVKLIYEESDNAKKKQQQQQQQITLTNKVVTSSFLKMNFEMKQAKSYINSLVDDMLLKYYPDKKEALSAKFIVCCQTTQLKISECINFISLHETYDTLTLPIHLKQCKIPLLHHLLCPTSFFKVSNYNANSTLEWIFVPIELPESTDKRERFGVLAIHLKTNQISYWSPGWTQQPSWALDMNHKLNSNDNYIYNMVIWNTRFLGKMNTDKWFIIFAIFEHIRGSKNLWLCQPDNSKLPDKHDFDWYEEDGEKHDLHIVNLQSPLSKQSEDIDEVAEYNEMIIKLIEEHNDS